MQLLAKIVMHSEENQMKNSKGLYLKKVFCVIMFLTCTIYFAQGVHVKKQSKGFFCPVAFEKYNSLLLITEVKINGSSRSCRFIFDTGSSDCAIFGSLANELGVRSARNHSVHDGTTKCDIGYAKLDFQISGISFKNLKTDILKNNPDNFLCGIDGIIGANLIKECAWEITSQGVYVSNSVKDIDTNSYKAQKIKMGSVPIAWAGLEKQYRGNVLFDLGYTGLYAIPKNNIKYVGKKDVLAGYGSYFQTMLTDRQIGKDTIEVFKPKYDFVFGEDTVFNSILDVCYDNNSPISVVGAEILDYYDLILDFSKRRLYTKQIKNTYSSAYYSSFGFKYYLVDNRMIVSFIWDKSSANNKGLEIGQEIESINDVEISKFNGDSCELGNRLNNILNNSNNIELKIKDVNDVISLKRIPFF